MLHSMKSVNLHLQRCLCRRKVYAVCEKSGNQLPTSRNGIKKDSTRNSGHSSLERACGQQNRSVNEIVSGSGTSIECKRSDSLEKHISQVVATCVIAGFTLKSTYPVSAVPVIMISLKKFLVVIYDCDSDVLFATDMILLVDKNNILIPSLVYFLHIVVNHR